MPELPISTENSNTQKDRRNKTKKFVEGKKYALFILIVIVVDFLMMGILTMKLSNFWINILSYVDYVIQAIFIIDVIINIYVYRCGYFKDTWKLLDLFTTIITTIPLGAFSQYSKFIRSFRVLRVIRVFSRLKYLRFLIVVLGKAIPQVAWIVLVQVILFYCYAVIGTMLFGETFYDWFGSVWLSLYSLFQIMTLESWSMGIARPVIAVYKYAWIYFVSFVILSSFILMNIVVGIVVNSIQTTTEDEEEENRQKHMNLLSQDKQVLVNLLNQLHAMEAAVEKVLENTSNNHIKCDEENVLPPTQNNTVITITEH